MSFYLIRALAAAGGIFVAGGTMAADIYSPMTPEGQKVSTESGWTVPSRPISGQQGFRGTSRSSDCPRPMSIRASAISSTILISARWPSGTLDMGLTASSQM